MTTYTVQAGQTLILQGGCGCRKLSETDTVSLFPAFAQRFIDLGIIA